MAEKRIKRITGTASTSAVPAKPAKMTARGSFYDTKSYAPTNAAASSVNTSVKREAIAGPYKKMNALDKSIATGVPMKSKNKNPGKFVR